MKQKTIAIIMILSILLSLTSCKQGNKQTDSGIKYPGINANMAFLYYKDMDKAINFYENVLGLEEVLDYGFAKAYRISTSSFVCLVDETGGMHKTTEPKTVTLSFITNEIEEWYEYLKSKEVEIRNPLGSSKNHPTRGFVAYDPEGYFLEFVTFLEHEQNTKLLEKLSLTKAMYPKTDKRPENLGIVGNVIWLYYYDLDKAQQFYEENLGLEKLVDQGLARVMTSSETCFIGLVDEARGLHHFSEKKSVNIGFFTNDVDGWFDLHNKNELKMHVPLDTAEEGKVRAFVVYDLAGYYLEFDEFNNKKENKRLLEILKELK